MENKKRSVDNGYGEENIRMNSTDLQKRFYTVYKSFFNAHNIVLSSPAVLTW